ncbi:hypothetical protein HAX54_050538 [Datura stramonium]|uniref:Uncharacterized protein n=1 Tax=Datura stramonium TaxID=4076 RepID=A0ABS8WNQ2_DATST|nr:hypothetical protein [Datura stramonium]
MGMLEERGMGMLEEGNREVEVCVGGGGDGDAGGHREWGGDGMLGGVRDGDVEGGAYKNDTQLYIHLDRTWGQTCGRFLYCLIHHQSSENTGWSAIPGGVASASLSTTITNKTTRMWLAAPQIKAVLPENLFCHSHYRENDSFTIEVEGEADRWNHPILPSFGLNWRSGEYHIG